MSQATESQFEAATIQRLRALGYDYQPASTLERDLKSVVLAGRLRTHLARRYPHPSTGSGRRLPAKALDEAVAAARNPDGVTLDQRNLNFHQTLTRGYELKYEADGQDRYEHIYFIDWDEPENNDFLVVNQLAVEGTNTRRLDLVVYVNGLPLVVFELKSPRDEYAGVAGTYNQLQHCLHDIPHLFEFNAGCVLSDGVHTLQGMHSPSILHLPFSVVCVMVDIRRQMARDDRRKQGLSLPVRRTQTGLTDEELAFYDAITYGDDADLIQDIDFLAELVQEIVTAVKRNLKVDWTKAHRQDVYAGVVSAVKLVLRKRRIRGEEFRFILNRVMQQAEAGYEDWPLVA